jgi:tRNA(Ile)-lysidine synthase
MTELAARVRRFAAEQGLWSPGARLVAAVSGGGDSVALFHLLRELAQGGHVVLAGVVHLNHRLRPDADRDEAFCRDLAAAAGVPFDAAQVDVAAAARAGRCSVEVAARRARFAFFAEVRDRREAAAVALAHTLDDQAETVLLRLLRGTGTRGLRGALAARPGVVRPLLRCGRGELRAYLAARRVSWLEDETNADRGLLRNRIRHDLLPLLARDYQPAARRLLARTAELAAADEACLEAMAIAAADGVSERAAGDSRVCLQTAPLLALPPALARRVVRRALIQAGATRSVRLADIDTVLAVCRHPQAAAARAAGLVVERFSAGAVLFSKGAPRAPGRIPPRTLAVPGQIDVHECGPGWRLRAEGPIRRERAPLPTRHRLVVDAARGPFTVRGRQPGDRLRPAGLGGSKSLQDLFVDRKVPRGERDRTPVVTGADGRIVWVVGLAVAEDLAAAAGEGDVVVLNFERPDGSGPEAT